MFLFKRKKKQVEEKTEENVIVETNTNNTYTDQELLRLSKQLDFSIGYKNRTKLLEDIRMVKLYYDYFNLIKMNKCSIHCRALLVKPTQTEISLIAVPPTDPGFKGDAKYIGNNCIIHISKEAGYSDNIQIRFYASNTDSEPKVNCYYFCKDAHDATKISFRIYAYLTAESKSDIVKHDFTFTYEKDEAFLNYLFYIIESSITKHLKELTDQLEEINKELETQILN